MNELDIIQIASKGSAVGVWSLVLIAVITAVKGWPALRQLSLEADGSLRRDLLAEVRQLRADVAAERRSCEEKLAVCDKHIAGLEGQVRGLERQLIQLQMSAGLPISLETPESDKAMDRMLKRRLDKLDEGEGK